jgi:pimeloyl-ACP methyl ester carboxylesterase
VIRVDRLGDALASSPRDRQSRRVSAPRVVTVLLASVLLVGCGGDHAPEKTRPRPAVTLVGVGSGDLVDVGGRDLYVECVGSGTPTVVLEAGFGGSSQNWTLLLSELGRTTRTCAYDRAGLGDSDAMPGVHDAGDEIKDLERLLDRGEIKAPYVLVGHSYGGLLARLFAHAHPDETGGVVLIDANGRDNWRRGFAAWPKTLAPKLRRAWAKPVGAGVDTKASAALGSGIRSLGATPLVVLTAAHDRELDLLQGLPPQIHRQWRRLMRVMQAELAALSSDHAHVLAMRSDHLIYRDQPALVVRAVRAVVRAVRDETPLPPCEQVFSGPGVRCLS